MANELPSGPRVHRDPAVVALKRGLLDAPHIERLTALAHQIGAERRADVPLFDPASGGVDSRVLLLLESPGPASSGSSAGSGLISIDNDDQTAANGFNGMAEAGLSRMITINWNIVPWYLSSVRRPSREEIRTALPYLNRVLEELTQLRVVVLLGAAAQQGWQLSSPKRPDLTVISAPHPSPMSLNRHPERRPQFVAALRQAAEAAA